MRKRLTGIERFKVYNFITNNPNFVKTITAAELANMIKDEFGYDVSSDSARNYARECQVPLRGSKGSSTKLKEKVEELAKQQEKIIKELEEIKALLNKQATQYTLPFDPVIG